MRGNLKLLAIGIALCASAEAATAQGSCTPSEEESGYLAIQYLREGNLQAYYEATSKISLLCAAELNARLGGATQPAGGGCTSAQLQAMSNYNAHVAQYGVGTTTDCQRF